MINNEKFFSLLKNKDLLDPKNIVEIERLIEKNNNFDLEKYLSREKVIGPEKITEVKAELYSLPYKNLVEEDISDAALNLLSEDLSKNYEAVCFYFDENLIKVGLLEPNLKAMEAVNFFAKQKKLDVSFYIISKTSFNFALKLYKKIEEEISSALEVKLKGDQGDFIEIKKEDEGDVMNVEDESDAPVAKIVSVIIKNAIASRASDIHIEPYENESRVRYRIDGILKNTLFLPKNIHNAVTSRIKVLSRMKLDETRIPQDGRIVLISDGREVDFRISTFPIGSSSMEKVVLRILDKAKGIISLEELGFNSQVLDVFRKNIKKTNGIILSTGPTGSGKTTTLYSIISILNKEGVNISTLEDPIEYQLKGINQSQIRPKIGYSFATGLRSLVRQDPDIIMVGEIRDEETAELSVHASLTGHLVLSTLHTNDALGTIFRLLDMKVEPVLLVSILRIVIAQRLARRLCKHCKKEMSPDLKPKVIEDIKKALTDIKIERLKKEISGLNSLDDINNLIIYEPVGCSRCQGTGYLERVAIGEIIEMDENLKNLIINNLGDLNPANVKKTQEFISIKQDGFLKVLNGLTNIEEVLRVIEV